MAIVLGTSSYPSKFISYYKGDLNKQLNDYGPNGLHLSKVGTVGQSTTNTPPRTNGWLLSGGTSSTNYLQMPITNIPIVTDFVVEGYLIPGNGAFQETLFSIENSDQSRYFSIRTNNTGTNLLIQYTNSGGGSIFYSSAIVVGTQYKFRVESTGSGTTLYINDINSGSNVAVASFGTIFRCVLGTGVGGFNTFSGSLGALAIGNFSSYRYPQPFL